MIAHTGQHAFVGETGAPEGPVRVHATGRVFLAVVDNGAVERFLTAQEVVEVGRTHGVAWREPERDAGLDRLRNVETEIAQTQVRAMCRGLVDADIADGQADAPLDRHLPARVRVGRRWCRRERRLCVRRARQACRETENEDRGDETSHGGLLLWRYGGGTAHGTATL